jgi:lysophospholipase L1-like esterase
MVGKHLSRFRDGTISVTNSSRGGMTARMVATNLPAVDSSVVAVVVELGGNDAMFGSTRDAIVSDLTAIVEHLQRANDPPAVFVMQIMPGDMEDQVCSKTGIAGVLKETIS